MAAVGSPSNTSAVQEANPFLGGIKIEVNIPEGATLAQVEETLTIGIERYRDLTEAREQLMPCIGRILYEVRERRLFRPSHKNFTGWLKTFAIKVGMAPSTLFDTLKVVKSFPSLSTEDYQVYGASRLLLVSRIANEATEGFQKILEESKSLTVDELKDRVQEIRKGDKRPKPNIIAVRCSDETYAKWTQLVKSNPTLTVAEIFENVLQHFIDSAEKQLVEEEPAKPPARRRQRSRAS